MERRRTEEAKDALKLMSFVSTIDPYSLSPTPDLYSDELISTWKKAGLEPNYALATHTKLWQGISDTVEIIHNALNDYDRSIPEEDAVSIAVHDTSVSTIAHAAQLGEKELRSTNARQEAYNSFIEGSNLRRSYSILDKDPTTARRFIIDDEIGAIVQNPDFDESWENRYPEKGCPFAHGEMLRSKAFDSFVRWAGILAVREYYEHKK